MTASRAGVIFIDPHTARVEGKNYLIVDQPSRAFQQLIDLFHPVRAHPSGFKGIHASAIIHESVCLEENVSIGPNAVLDEGVKIGANSFIGAGTYVGCDTWIGTDCMIHPGVIIRENCRIGNRVTLQPGVVIGACGFGYTTDGHGYHHKLNQVGNVIIENDVEVGANTTIDRSRFKSTVISEGTKIDNLVQVGHGARIGKHNLIVAQVGIAGSSSTGKHVMLGGQSGLAGHLHLDDGVLIAGKSAVTKSLKKGRYGGIPAIPLHEYNRNQVYLRRIEKFIERLKSLEMHLNYKNRQKEDE
jgi:UDP-3-O-[3-hydroxymyristoyl] glucosamine N-acyltransferase